MNQNGNSGNGVSGLLGKMAAEKKKTGIALCLIAIMMVMWVKVLTKKGPESSQASPAVQAADVDKDLDDAVNITHVDLPQAPGRDDLISRDFFASAGWQDFGSDYQEGDMVDVKDVGAEKTDDTKEVAAIVTQYMKLEAIIMGQRPQAFINDKLMSVGERLVVTDAAGMYECEVVEIRENSVLIRCRDAEIVLKLVQTVEGNG
jgi:hypothetical protein